MAKDPSERPHKPKSKYTADRGMPGAFEGETVTRRALFTGGALAAGGGARAGLGLPALGFALGPIIERTEPERFEDVGPVGDFNPQTYVPKMITITEDIGEPGKTTVYVRKKDPSRDTDKMSYPYIAISTRCAHLGCPVRYVQAAERFICPCHGGVLPRPGPRRLLRLRRQGARRPAGAAARPLRDQGRERPRARGPALLGE